EERGGHDGDGGGFGDALALHRPRIENGGDQRFPAALARSREIIRASVGLLGEVFLVPKRITAFDYRDRTDAPVLFRLVQPFERARVPWVLLASRLMTLRPHHVDDDDQHARRKYKGAD